MNWLLFALLAYFLLAISATIDKFLLTKKIPEPIVYAFYISSLNGLAIFGWPLGVQLLSAWWLGLSFLSGVLLVLALAYFFTAMRDNDATRVVPFTSGATPLLTVLFSAFLFDERLTQFQFIAFGLLVVATVLISINFENKKSRSIVGVHNLILAGLFFALSYTLTKYIYLHQDFLSVFVWSRVGTSLGAFALLLIPTLRRKIFQTTRSMQTSKGSRPWFILGQTTGAAGIITLNYAIKLGSVSIINALQGSQQVFVLMIAAALHSVNPKLLDERFTPLVVVQKVVAIGLLAAGLVMLAIA